MKLISRRSFLKAAGIASVGAAMVACGGNSTATSGSTASSGSSDANALDPTKLTVQLGPNPETLDPALNSAIDGANYIIHLFETLLIVDEHNEVKPGQAESYTVSEDGLTWTFTLRDGLKWSDGSDLTANDFVYSWKRVCDPNLAAPYAETVLGMVKGFTEATGGDLDALGVSAPDDKTFVVELAKPCTYFDKLAAFATLSPVQQATVEANGDGWAVDASTYVSNGSYYMTEWVPSDHITLTKNPNYWDYDNLGTFETITCLLQEDGNTSYSAFQTGEAQMIKTVPTEEIPSLTGTDEFHVETIMGTYYVSLNVDGSVPVFMDANVRKALSLAVDREYVANTVMQGTYTPAYNFVGPGITDADGATPFMDVANGGVSYIPEDFETSLEEAKQLLSDAGYPNGEGFPAIVYKTNDDSYHVALAEYLQSAWGELGISMSIEKVEWASFTPTRRAGDFEVARNGWVCDYNDPSSLLDLFCTGNGNNDGKFSNADYDAAMEESRTTADLTERFAALHKAEDILMDQMACVPVAYYADFWLQDTRLVDTWHSAYGYWYFMYGTYGDGSAAAADSTASSAAAESVASSAAAESVASSAAADSTASSAAASVASSAAE